MDGNSAYDPGATWLIARVTATGGETSLTFSSIPQTYKSLQIRGITRRADAGSTIATDNLRFNGDTGTNYTYHSLTGNGTTASATWAGGATSDIVFSRGAGATATAGIFGSVIADIHDYASTTKNKTTRSFTGFDLNGSGNIYLYSGLWLNTAAITSITIYPNGNTIAAGTTYALYGMKG